MFKITIEDDKGNAFRVEIDGDMKDVFALEIGLKSILDKVVGEDKWYTLQIKEFDKRLFYLYKEQVLD